MVRHPAENRHTAGGHPAAKTTAHKKAPVKGLIKWSGKPVVRHPAENRHTAGGHPAAKTTAHKKAPVKGLIKWSGKPVVRHPAENRHTAGGHPAAKTTAHKKAPVKGLIKWSGKPGSNRRPVPWQGTALPTELFPLIRQVPPSHLFELSARPAQLAYRFAG